MRLTLTGMMLLFTMALTAQAVVRGVVTSSEDGEPLIGVTVFVKGTTTGTATDLDGSYEIQVDPATGVLVFSYTGFRSQEVSIGGRTTLDVQLEVASEVLSEVIVTAFGNRPGRSLPARQRRLIPNKLPVARSPTSLRLLQVRAPGFRRPLEEDSQVLRRLSESEDLVRFLPQMLLCM